MTNFKIGGSEKRPMLFSCNKDGTNKAFSLIEKSYKTKVFGEIFQLRHIDDIPSSHTEYIHKINKIENKTLKARQPYLRVLYKFNIINESQLIDANGRISNTSVFSITFDGKKRVMVSKPIQFYLKNEDKILKALKIELYVFAYKIEFYISDYHSMEVFSITNGGRILGNKKGMKDIVTRLTTDKLCKKMSKELEIEIESNDFAENYNKYADLIDMRRI